MRKLFKRIKLAFKHANSLSNFFCLLKHTDKELEQMFCDHKFSATKFIKGGNIEKTCEKCGKVVIFPNPRKKS